MKQAKLFFLSVGSFIFSQSFSQSVTPATMNASGGTRIITYYQFDWSFGEAMAIETMSPAGNIQVTNGVLQPGTGFPGLNNTSIVWGAEEIKILPNPVKDLLEIDFLSNQRGKVTMSLFNSMGGLLTNKQFDYFGVGRIEKWSFTKYPSGAYFLKIQLVPTNGSVPKNSSFTIIKAK